MAEKPEACKACGNVHDDNPFPRDVMDLARRVAVLEPGEERTKLLMQLADLSLQRGVAGEDWADIDTPERFHRLGERYAKARSNAMEKACRLGRAILQTVESHDWNTQTGLYANGGHGPVPVKKTTELN
jgi:hypothetical protein